MATDIVLKSFRVKKILTIEELALLLNRSIITARRFLKKCEGFTSINKNARYYTLPNIPEFDNNGLWNYKGVFFSRHGNLRQTVVHLVTKSDRGLSADDIEKMVGLADNSSFMSTFKYTNAMKRETYGGKGSGRYIYFAKNRERYQHQQARRSASITSLPSDSDAIAILVTLIRHPNSSAADLAAILGDKGNRINQNSIDRLLVHHGLKKKQPNNC